MHVGVWHEGCSIRFWFIHRAFRWGDFFLMETNCAEQGCCVFLPKSQSFSRTQPGLSLPPNAAILDKFMKKQMAATGFLPAVFSLYTVFGWKILCNSKTLTICLCLSITLLSSSLNKKRAIAFVRQLCICFLVICTVAEKDFLKAVLGRKIAPCYEVFVNCQLMLKSVSSTIACDEVCQMH